MNSIANQRPGYSMAWSPAPVKRLPAPTLKRPALGQTTEFAESPLLAFLTSATLASSSAFLAWGLANVKDDQGRVVGNRWSTFFWVVSGISFVKLLHDTSRM